MPQRIIYKTILSYDYGSYLPFSISAFACCRHDWNQFVELEYGCLLLSFKRNEFGGNSNRPTQGNGVLGRLNRSSSDFNQGNGAGNSFRESNQFLDGSDVKRAGMIGLGVIASLATVGIIYRVCFRRRSAHPSDDVLLQYPELEHPELTLTSIPKEALSSFSVDRDVVLANSSKAVH